MSRDIATLAYSKALLYAACKESERPKWWGHLPWEDVVMATLLKGHTTIHHHRGFKAAWDICSKDTVLKHLDNQAPSLTQGLAEQDWNGLWDVKAIECSVGDYTPGKYFEWQSWRNSLPDAAINGKV